MDKVLGIFQMEHSKKHFLQVRHGIHLSKSMSPKTPIVVMQMSRIPYASAIGSLIDKTNHEFLETRDLPCDYYDIYINVGPLLIWTFLFKSLPLMGRDFGQKSDRVFFESKLKLINFSNYETK